MTMMKSINKYLYTLKTKGLPMHITPDSWRIIRITTPEETIYKVFGCWLGGFATGDSWRLNSGIVKVESDENYFYLHGISGSVYKCHKSQRRMSMYCESTLASLIDSVNFRKDTSAELLSEESVYTHLQDLICST
jgi:hypothetical protein